jgi:hypothetical protein
MRLLEITCLLALAAGASVATADPVDLKPFRATYAVQWKGITAGNLTLELKRPNGDVYHYSSASVPRGMFRIALPDEITQETTFRIVDGRVVQSEFRGSDEKERPIQIVFDWTRKRATGVAKGKTIDLELPDGTLDPLSMQIASLRSLANGTLQSTVKLMDSDKIKDYELNREGTAQIETGVGKLDTIIFTSKHAGGERLTRTWVAPALGYLPVRGERLRGTKLEFTMTIVNVDR